MNKGIILDFRGKLTEIRFTDTIQGITIVGFGDSSNIHRHGGLLSDVMTIEERNQIILTIMNRHVGGC